MPEGTHAQEPRDAITSGLGRWSQESWPGGSGRCYPDRLPTIVHNLARGRTAFADRVLLESDDGSPTVTYAEFAELVEGAAERLAEEGVRPGDRVAVCLRNGLDAAVAIWACARAGFIVVGLPVTLRATQWAFQLRHSGAVLALGHEEFLGELREAGAEAGLPPDRVRPVGDHLTGRRRAWDETRALPDQDTTYAVIFTSGTTGHPKAARLTGRMTMHAAEFYVRTLGLTPADRTAIHLPFYYLSGHVTQLNPVMLAGGAGVAIARFAPRELVALLRDRGITFLDVVPSMWTLLLRDPAFDVAELGHVRIAAYGGSPMPAGTVRRLRERMPQLRLFDVYGMSETVGTITCLPDHEQWRRPGSVGRPVPCVDVRIVGDDGTDAPPGEPGEVWVRGPVVTPGYFADEAETAATITDGWLRTGDIARVDSEGYVYVLDRKKDMIIRGAAKIYSVELEYLLVRHPAIVEAAVVGVPDPVAYEAVAAWVVPAPGETVEAPAVQAWVRDHMAAHAVPRYVRVVDAIPRNPTGKIDKVHLRGLLTPTG